MPAENIKIIVLGGTFDPLHNGHLTLAEQVLEQLGAEEVWLLVSKQQPLRESCVASATERLEMARAVARTRPHLRVIENEINRPAPSYTIDTVNEFIALGISDTLWWLMGVDVARGIQEWRNSKELLSIIKVVIANRSSQPLISTEEAAKLGFDESSTKLVTIDSPLVSATEVRRRLYESLSVQELIPPEVNLLINERGLYRS